MSLNNQIVKAKTDLKVQVHPLVVMNVSDHSTRSKYIQPVQRRVLGVILGKQEGKVIEMNNSLEIKFSYKAGKIEIDEGFMDKRVKAYKLMFPNLDALGWYSSSNDLNNDFPLEDDLKLQESIKKHCENPIYLILNTESEDSQTRGTIPIFLFETNEVLKQFEQLDFQLAQSEDERIAVDNVAKAIDPNAKQSSLSTSMISSVNAIKLLRRKIKMLVDIFQNSPEVQKDASFNRRLNQICSQIEVLGRPSDTSELYSDVATLNMLATATKGFESLQELVSEFKVITKSRRQGGMFGNDVMSTMMNAQMDI